MWAKTMEDGKSLDCTIEESSGVGESTCIESMAWNWRDLPLHDGSRKENTYKPRGESDILQKRSRKSS